MQEVPKDLGQRIMVAARLALALHLESQWKDESRPVGGAPALDGVRRTPDRLSQSQPTESEAA